MASTKIRIVSNPYEQNIDFYQFESEWVPVDRGHNPKSALIDSKIVRGFLPFKAIDILNAVKREFWDGSTPVEIAFEGPGDEFDELALAAGLDKDGAFNVFAAPRRLANARDVLPDIIDLYRRMRPLVDVSIDGKDDILEAMDKFDDASSDSIPIVVLGNYSAGKSTFINALVGCELLPSGDDPVTARIFQISDSGRSDEASVSFEKDGCPVSYRFDEDGIIQDEGVEPDEFNAALLTHVVDAGRSGLIGHVYSVLEFLNMFKGGEDGPQLSDLVEIVAPFNHATGWSETANFIIFDTPGSNSASNLDHSRVLSKAMEGLSNGLAMFVTTYDSFDSTDNVALYNKIRDIDAIDERFAMLVVNKADFANLPKDPRSEAGRNKIENSSLKRNLDPEGVYFVSSILGLGYKTDGVLMDDNYGERYEDQVRKYVDTSATNYKTLYRYDILPGQIEDRMINDAEECSDLLYANSGLSCVEHQIELFAKKYSAYNKCFRSYVLISDIIDATKGLLSEAKETTDRHRQDLSSQLEEEKEELLEKLDQESKLLESADYHTYDKGLEANSAGRQGELTLGYVARRETELADEVSRRFMKPEQHDEFMSHLEELRNDTFKDGVNVDSVNLALSRVADLFGEYSGLKDLDARVEETVVAEFSEELQKKYAADIEMARNAIHDWSVDFWYDAQDGARKRLYEIASDTKSIDGEKRQEILELIASYPSIDFTSHPDEILGKDNLRKKWVLFGHEFFAANEIDSDKTIKQYNRSLSADVEQIKGKIGSSHKEKFGLWLNTLMDLIRNKIVDYNPTLTWYSNQISEDNARIGELNAKLNELDSYRQNIAALIGWIG
jgi:GTPase SAR1 family protein